MKKYILPLIFLLCLIFNTTVLALTYTSQYPTQDNDHVKATTTHANAVFETYFATDPALSKTGSADVSVTWYAANTVIADQRFHIDLGSAKIIRRIYYENFHHNGGTTINGVNNFTFWGSNTEASFLELTYATDTGWTEITVATNVFLEHVALDQVDPQYIVATNAVAYRYYAFKIEDNHSALTLMGIRHVDLQTEDGYTPPTGITWNGITITKWNGITITIPINTQ